MFRKLKLLLYEETFGFDPVWQLAKFLMLPFPLYTAGRIRTHLLRQLGFQIGQGTMIWDTPKFIGSKHTRAKVSIGDYCLLTIGSYWDLAAPIRIGNAVTLAPEVMLLTGTHDFHNPQNRAGKMEARPVTICDGVWLGARSMILPGVTVGEGAIVGAGAVVTKDVPPHTLVAGVPAVFIRKLSEEK
jgi:acetyltransferase-like isoleucine patch superfamily enzyme